jgi:DNA polymerase III subunit epsilon
MAAAIPILLAAPALKGPVACVDLETTGGTAAQHRITEVGIVLLDDGVVVEEWSSLVNPCQRIPPSIVSFTGITNAMVEDAPTFADLRSEVRARLEGRLFVAHNARFDYGFVRSEFRRSGEKFSAPVLCTVRLSRALFAGHQRHNLDALIDRWGLPCGQRHRALGDAAVLPELLAAFERAVGTGRLQEFVEASRFDSRLPPQLPPDLADDLPEGPGVYLFRGECGVPLYVGKSRNLRSRVLDHFSAAHRSSKEAKLGQQVRAVEWIETGGELGALLLESRMVKDLAPSANRRLRKASGVYCVRLQESGGSLRPSVELLTLEDLDSAAEVYGLFRSERDAVRALEGKAREAGLCLKVMGLEKGPGSCFALQLGRCRGSCIGKEPLPLHDTRLRLAMASMRLRPWPFPGPVGIRERAADGAGTLLHVVDRWQHLGTARDEAEVNQLLRSPGGRVFDPDSYRLIVRYLDRLSSRDLVIFGRRES